MTKQQIKDYEKIQSKEELELWIRYVPEYKDCKRVEELPLKCAISDIESLADNLTYSVRDCNDEEWLKADLEKLRKAKWFLKKWG